MPSAGRAGVSRAARPTGWLPRNGGRRRRPGRSLRSFLLFALLWSAAATSSARLEAGAEPAPAPPAEASDDAERAREAGAGAIFDAVTVVGAKLERRVGEVAGTATVIDREELDRRQAHSLEDLVRYQPSIGVTGEAGRFGSGGFRIRGMGGNRVAVEVDGVPVPDGFAIGSFADAGRDLVEPELLRTVEILRGPASALHGSDALGGIVLLTTREPADFVSVAGEVAGGLRFHFDGRDRGARASGIAAGAGELWRAVGLVSLRTGHELDNNGEVEPDPADSSRASAYLRVDRSLRAGTIGITLDRESRRVETDVRHLVGGPAQFATTERLLGDDRQERSRVAATLLLGDGSGAIVESTTRAYWSRYSTVQETAQWRRPDARTRYPTRRDRRFDFDEELAGAEWSAESSFRAGATQHRLVWGAELEGARLTERRDGQERNLDSGEVTDVILGEVLPVRDLPRSVTRSLGVFVADEISLGSGRWRLQPALRYDRHALDARPDALYREDFPDTLVVSNDFDALTPKVGLTRELGRGHSAYLQYAEGFRAPPGYDVNIGLRIPLFDYEALPNPDLRPERSRGVEIGWRHAGPRVAAQLALFENRYRDLIESRVNLGLDPDTGVTLFQSLNRDRAVIRGAEALFRVDLGKLSRRTLGWSIDAAMAWTAGEDTRRQEPLNSVDPPKATLGVSWAAADGRWWASAVGTWVRDKAGEVDVSVAPVFAPPGYQLLDLYGRWRPGARWTVDLAVLNLFDRKYWSYARVGSVRADDRQLDFHTAPGRGLLVGVALEF